LPGLNNAFKANFKAPVGSHIYVDVCFRTIFGSRGMEDVLLSLVNSILLNAGLSTVVKLEIRNPYVLRRWRNDKEPVVDVRATDEE